MRGGQADRCGGGDECTAEELIRAGYWATCWDHLRPGGRTARRRCGDPLPRCRGWHFELSGCLPLRETKTTATGNRCGCRSRPRPAAMSASRCSHAASSAAASLGLSPCGRARRAACRTGPSRPDKQGVDLPLPVRVVDGERAPERRATNRGVPSAWAQPSAAKESLAQRQPRV
jgi:hypothetical protein